MVSIQQKSELEHKQHQHHSLVVEHSLEIKQV
jgi:hypothetical protein